MTIAARGAADPVRRAARQRFALLAAGVCVAVAVAPGSAAQAAQGTEYRLDRSVVGSVGAGSGSTGYEAITTGGEAFVGPAASTSYALGTGLEAQLQNAITLAIDASAVSLAVVPGASSSAATTLSVRTDGPGYSLTVAQDRDLLHTDGVSTIPAISATIAAPAPWAEGTTRGFGFTLVSATGLDAKWGTSPSSNYAAIPTAATAIHIKDGEQSTDDVTVVQYRIDASATQKAGSYSNTVTYTALARA